MVDEFKRGPCQSYLPSESLYLLTKSIFSIPTFWWRQAHMARVMCPPVPGSNCDMMWMVHCVLNNPELGSKR